MKTAKYLIEVDGEHNESLVFNPARKTLRGRFCARRAMEFDDGAARLVREFPEAIPGQQIEVDAAAGTVALVEPLHQPQYAALRQKLQSRGFTLSPEREAIEGADLCTWVYWANRAVKSGLARVVAGEKPTVAGEPRKRFHATAQVETSDRIAAALERQNELLEKLLTKLAN